MEQAIIWAKSQASNFFGPFQGVEVNFSKKTEILENHGFSLITHHRQMELYSNLVHK